MILALLSRLHDCEACVPFLCPSVLSPQFHADAITPPMNQSPTHYPPSRPRSPALECPRP